jgi:hypothetical protein
MAKKIFLSDIDLALNQLLQAKLQHLPADPAGSESRIYYNTVIKKVKYYNGSDWLTVIDDNDPRLTDSRTAKSHVIATNTGLGAEHTISGAAAGMVLRASGAASANFQILAHSDLEGSGTNTHLQIDAHLGDATKHRVINDSGASNIDLFSASKILQLIADVNSSVAGSLIYKGGYDASSNTPALDTGSPGVTQGWTYVVTVAGSFFSESVQVGDMIIAKQTNPTVLSHWTVVNKNIPDIVSATETAEGIIRIATTAETTAGTNDTKAVSPLKLKQLLGTTGTVSNARKYSQTIGDGVSLSYAVSHGLSSTTVQVTIFRTATPFDVVDTEVVITNTGTITANFNVAPTAGQYTIVIVG